MGDTLVTFFAAQAQHVREEHEVPAKIGIRNNHPIAIFKNQPFGVGTNQWVFFNGVMPSNKTPGGAIEAYVYFTTESGVTGNARWIAQFKRDPDLDANPSVTQRDWEGAGPSGVGDIVGGKIQFTYSASNSLEAGDPFRYVMKLEEFDSTIPGPVHLLAVELRNSG